MVRFGAKKGEISFRLFLFNILWFSKYQHVKISTLFLDISKKHITLEILKPLVDNDMFCKLG